MPRKTHFKKSKPGTRNMRKSKRMTNTSNRMTRYKTKSRKYRGKGGCSNGTCMNDPTPQWTSKGGDSELISKDINNYVTDGSFYSSVN